MKRSSALVTLGWLGATVGGAAAQPPGERLAEVSTVAVTEVNARCLELPEADPGMVLEGAILATASCEVVDSGRLAPPGRWLWALTRRDRVYRPGEDTPDRALEFFPDTIAQDELVLFRVDSATGRARPVWRDRSDRSVAFIRAPRASAAPDADGLVLAHRRCLNGTGGCADHPFRLAGGAVRPLEPAHVEELARRLPLGWDARKGVWLDPDSMLARAPVHLPGDANCCPAFRARATLSLIGDTLEIDSLALVPEPGADAWRIVPGRRFGHVREDTSADRLRLRYGATAVEPAQIELGEGLCAPGARLFSGTPYAFEVAWVDAAAIRPAFARVFEPGGPWRTPAGVRPGLPLAELEELRGEPITFSGFGWDYGGGATWTEGEGSVVLHLQPDPGALRELQRTHPNDDRVDALFGEGMVRSDQPLVDRVGVRVGSITMGWTEPEVVRDCEI